MHGFFDFFSFFLALDISKLIQIIHYTKKNSFSADPKLHRKAGSYFIKSYNQTGAGGYRFRPHIGA
jgi:hypothetical protein